MIVIDIDRDIYIIDSRLLKQTSLPLSQKRKKKEKKPPQIN